MEIQIIHEAKTYILMKVKADNLACGSCAFDEMCKNDPNNIAYRTCDDGLDGTSNNWQEKEAK